MCGKGHVWWGDISGRGVCVAGRVCMARGASVAGACMVWGVCVAGGHVWQGDMRGRGVCVAGEA